MGILGASDTDQHYRRDTPVAVLTRTFPVDATLTSLWAFLRDCLGQASLDGEELMRIATIVGNAFTNIDERTKAVTVSLRVFSRAVEVDVLLSETAPDTGVRTHVAHGVHHVSYHYQRRHR